jgi:hypothetical protein
MSCVSSHVNAYSIAESTHIIDEAFIVDAHRSSSLLDEATRLVQLGFSVIPLKPDGSKAPLVAWGPTRPAARPWKSSRPGSAIRGLASP